MIYKTLISTSKLARHLYNDDWVIVDCRFQLDDTEAGRQAYLDAHIPGARYAHLDEDLSGPIIPGETGRHPLPSPQSFAQTLSAWGIGRDTQAVAYDNMSGVFAGRLWWMLRWLGHDKVSILDGTWRHWVEEGHPTANGQESYDTMEFVPDIQSQMEATVDEVITNLETKHYKLFDVRDESRYRGEAQGMDPVAGHIPGAQSAFFGANLDADGKFLPPEELRAHYQQLLNNTELQDTIFYCGSGVSVHHDLIAMEVAGLGTGARAYIGSWSDWINDPTRPVATGEQP